MHKLFLRIYFIFLLQTFKYLFACNLGEKIEIFFLLFLGLKKNIPEQVKFK